MEKRFAGKVAFVTGATTGIGQATAVRLASEGALVGVNQRPSDDPGETLRRIKEVGGDAFPVVADVRSGPGRGDGEGGRKAWWPPRLRRFQCQLPYLHDGAGRGRFHRQRRAVEQL